MSNYGLSPRSNSGWYYQQMREHNPEQWDGLIQEDLDTLRSLHEQPAFDFDITLPYTVDYVDGGLGVSQFGTLFFVGVNQEEVSQWLQASSLQLTGSEWDEAEAWDAPLLRGDEWDINPVDEYQPIDMPEEYC